MIRDVRVAVLLRLWWDPYLFRLDAIPVPAPEPSTAGGGCCLAIPNILNVFLSQQNDPVGPAKCRFICTPLFYTRHPTSGGHQPTRQSFHRMHRQF